MLEGAAPRGLALPGQTGCRTRLLPGPDPLPSRACRGGVVLAGGRAAREPQRSRGCLWRRLRWRRL